MSKIYTHSSGGKLYQSGAKEIPQILRDNNISLLVLAAEEYQPGYIRNTNGNFNSAEIIYVPMKDTIFFTPSKFKDTVRRATKASDQVAKHLEEGNNVLSTCWAGLNRSGLVSGLAMRQISSLTGRQIVSQIRSNRSSRALSNPLFANVVKH